MNRLATATLLGALFTLLGGSLPACAKVFLTVDEALALAFPECEVVRRTVFLTDEQRSAAEERSGAEIRSSLVHPYAATCAGTPAGVAYFDTHRVRTLPETIMVVIESGGEVGRVEVLSFREPEDYIPRSNWYDQFDGRQLDRELSLKKSIRSVTGATLTARATTEAVRRVLALHQVIAETAP